MWSSVGWLALPRGNNPRESQTKATWLTDVTYKGTGAMLASLIYCSPETTQEIFGWGRGMEGERTVDVAQKISDSVQV